MLSVGIILFTIGLLMLSPLDEIFVILPLSAMVGMWVFPLFFIFGLLCLVFGALLIGRHILPLVENPVVMIMLFISLVFIVYLVIDGGWATNLLGAI